MAADVLHHRYHFQHGRSSASSKVDSPALASAVEILQGTNVCRSQIRDVDVVADCSAVGRGIIGPKDLQALALFKRGPNGQGNQVSFVQVLFAQFATEIGAGGVEIAESHP